MTNNWYDRKNSSLVSINKFINSNRKDDIIETIQKKKLDGDKEKGIIRKGIVKEMLERIERQQDNSTLTNSKDGTLRKELDIGKDIVKERNMIRKEKENDSLEKTNNIPRNDDSSKEMFGRQNNEMIHRKLDTKKEEKLVNKDGKDDSSKKSNSFKEEIDERLKSMDYTRDNNLVELAKKIEILNSLIDIKEMKMDITVLEITELSDNEKPDRHIKNIICHKCKVFVFEPLKNTIGLT